MLVSSRTRRTCIKTQNDSLLKSRDLLGYKHVGKVVASNLSLKNNES